MAVIENTISAVNEFVIPHTRTKDGSKQLQPQEPEMKYVPIYVLSCFFGFILIFGPLFVPKGPNRGIIRWCITMSAFFMWIFWVTMYIAQMNPLMGPRLHNTTVVWFAHVYGEKDKSGSGTGGGRVGDGERIGDDGGVIGGGGSGDERKGSEDMIGIRNEGEGGAEIRIGEESGGGGGGDKSKGSEDRIGIRNEGKAEIGVGGESGGGGGGDESKGREDRIGIRNEGEAEIGIGGESGGGGGGDKRKGNEDLIGIRNEGEAEIGIGGESGGGGGGDERKGSEDLIGIRNEGDAEIGVSGDDAGGDKVKDAEATEHSRRF